MRTNAASDRLTSFLRPAAFALTSGLKLLAPLSLVTILWGCAGETPESLKDLRPRATDLSLSNPQHLLMDSPFASKPAFEGTGNRPSRPTYSGLRPQEPSTPETERPEVVKFVLNDNNTVVAFNCELGHAEWVAWTVSSSDLGNTPRSKGFHPEPRLPSSNCINPQPEDIGRSGYDRGHMAPSGDRTRTREVNSAVFSMANIVPQAPQVNQKGWNDLEIMTRDLVRGTNRTAHVVSGTFGSLGKIPGSGINIPAVTWKVVVVTGEQGQREDIPPKIQTIAIWYPNELHAPPVALKRALVSIDEIESRTNLDFLASLDDSVEEELESAVPTLPR